MKKGLQILWLLLLALSYVQAQAPQKISYQAVVRNETELVVNKQVGMRISILQGSLSGNVVYSEIHTPLSNSNGLITFEIGSGINSSGIFSEIQWSSGLFFIKTEADISGGTNYTLTNTQQLLSVPYALYAEVAGNAVAGARGADGKTILNGTTNPTAEGVNGDFYLNTFSQKLFGPKNNGSWGTGISLLGAQGPVGLQGAAGQTGTSGVDGKTILNGTIDPTTEGVNGDFYINTTIPKLFGPKNNGNWGTGISLIGTQGSQGVSGQAGVNGVDGKTILSGIIDPTVEGINGDFYINSTTQNFFGPKANGSWGTGISLVGDQGSAGANGNDGKTILNGTLDPTTEGLIGDFFLNTATTKLFGPKTSAGWGNGVSLIGNADAGWSLTGNAGTNAVTNFIGTTDAQNLNFKVNNENAGRIEFGTTPNTFFGYQAGNGNSGVQNIGIGYQSLFQNQGANNIAIGHQSLLSNTSGILNVSIGTSSLAANTTGHRNVAIGIRTLEDNTTGNSNSAIGMTALANNTSGVGNSALGSSALTNNTGGFQNTAMGVQSLFANTTGNFNTAVGLDALNQNKAGNEATAVGYGALRNSNNQTISFSNTNVAIGFESIMGPAFVPNTGLGNTATGYRSLKNNSTGSNNVAIGLSTLGVNSTGGENTAVGTQSLQNNTTGNNNTGVGKQTLNLNTIGNNNTALGYLANVGSNNLTNATALGANSIVSTSNTIQLGDGNVTQVIAGTGVNATLIAGGLKITGGSPALGSVLTSDANGVATWQTFSGSGWSLSGNSGTNSANNFIGTTDAQSLVFKVNNQQAGRISSSSVGNLFYGLNSGAITSGPINTGIGQSSLSSNTTGTQNTALGWRSMFTNISGIENTAVGALSLNDNTSGNKNTAVGSNALQSNTIGNANVALGEFALGANQTGGFNTGLGFQANVASNNLTNATAIGAHAIVSASNAVQLGDDNVTQVLAGTGMNATLISGGLKITGGTPAIGKVLTSDASGVATWQPQTGGGWGLSGNIGTDEAANFIGTTDAHALNFKVNNEKAGKIEFTTNANTFYGFQSGNTNTGIQNIGAGYQSLFQNQGKNNVAVGYKSLFSNTTGESNSAIGMIALSSNTTGLGNSAFGMNALVANTTGSINTAIGVRSLIINTDGSFNTAVGFDALHNNTIGGANTALGYHATVSANNLNNATAIGASAIVTASNTIQLGDGNVTQVIAGTGTNATLISGGLKITGGSPAVGKVLTSDASGVATWQVQTGGGWGLNGNAGTDGATNFIGTTDAQALNFKVNNEKAGRIEVGTNPNTFFGFQAGNNNTGTKSLGIGYQSLFQNQSDNNIGIGYQSLYSNTTGHFNSAFGNMALKANITGGFNTAIGTASLLTNSSGSGNAAFGHNTLLANTTGGDNTAIGIQSLSNNTIGRNNTAVGSNTLYFNVAGSGGIAIGADAMRNANNQTTAFQNTNVAIGFESIAGTVDPSSNTGLGNTATGYQSLKNNSSGSNNLANGNTTLISNTTGGENTAVGAQSLQINTTGNNNTGVGKQTLALNTTGSNNTAVGYLANVSANNLTNATAVGANSIVSASNNMVFGNNGVIGWGFGTSPVGGADAIRVGTDATNGNGATLSLGGVWTNTSDRNKKENFTAIDRISLLNKIAQLPITQWNYKGESRSVTHIGPMAQDFFNLFQVGKDDKSISTIDPAGIALAAIQQLIKENEQLKYSLKSLTQENLNLQSQVEAKQFEFESRLRKIEQLMSAMANK
jgi:ribosomal protein S6E (S10)